MQEYLEKTRQELKLRNYSFKTIKAYLGCLKEYFDFKRFDLEKIDEEKINPVRNSSGALNFTTEQWDIISNGVKQFLLNKRSKNYSSQTVNLYPHTYT